MLENIGKMLSAIGVAIIAIVLTLVVALLVATQLPKLLTWIKTLTSGAQDPGTGDDNNDDGSGSVYTSTVKDPKGTSWFLWTVTNSVKQNGGVGYWAQEDGVTSTDSMAGRGVTPEYSSMQQVLDAIASCKYRYN